MPYKRKDATLHPLLQVLLDGVISVGGPAGEFLFQHGHSPYGFAANRVAPVIQGNLGIKGDPFTLILFNHPPAHFSRIIWGGRENVAGKGDWGSGAWLPLDHMET